jgi:Activator of Hsp90 ATPase homolog 1-like protein
LTCDQTVAYSNELFAAAEGHSRCTFEIEPAGDVVKLTVIHEIDGPKSKLIEAVSDGWPTVLSSLKSPLETGESLEMTRHWPEGV